MIYFMLLRLSPLFGTSLAEDPQKESSAFSKKHPRRFSYTPRACSIPYLSGTSFLQRHPTAPFRSVLWPLLHSALVQVLTIAQGIKNPDGSSGTSGQLTASRERAAFSLGAALAPRCGPFPVSQRSRLVNLHCSRSASSTISHLHSTRQLRLARSPKLFPQRGCQPAGVGRLKVRLACVERATTMRTGSVWLVFISTCTRCGGTHTKSPACASWASSSWSPL